MHHTVRILPVLTLFGLLFVSPQAYVSSSLAGQGGAVSLGPLLVGAGGRLPRLRERLEQARGSDEANLPPPLDPATYARQMAEMKRQAQERSARAVELEAARVHATPEPQPLAELEAEAESQRAPGRAAEPYPEARPELSPEMLALRDRIRGTLAFYRRQPFNTANNTPDDVLQLCLAFGRGAEINAGGASDQKVSAIAVLLSNYPCGGYHLLVCGQGLFMARVGYGLEQHPGQLLAVLAQAEVDSNHEIRVGDSRGTVADLVKSEMRGCRSGGDLSFILMGLAYYLDNEETWENDLGEVWSLEKVVEQELARSVDRSSVEELHRLMGLSVAIHSRIQDGRPLEGQFLRAGEFIDTFQEHTLGLQNSDGSWHPSFFAYRGTSRDQVAVLRSTGHILEWLAFSLPHGRLQDPGLVKSVDHVTNLLASQSKSRYLTATSPRDLSALAHALHALSIYDERVFKPLDSDESAGEAPELAEAGGR